ncbi:Putative tyrosine-protein kinase in cps region [Paraburkholderia nemoris]|uniref:polysaccharide biosynthesis tyrosine autokinase n=1 Tax=Paraburkholderia nemoris TaxID=2793076 RepID=UPI00190B8159|nr:MULTISPECIES: polysaccharide biosynthesis tyrosine autokinase [Paraburkholderia]MBK3786693.1 polysaccharide biosynthesis tyrosine autokinase [Paraburkholderia aspalathi]CAE6844886.1 Putative tyrosine-protein kinase in cps region [Paraburkholderia nemoris]
MNVLKANQQLPRDADEIDVRGILDVLIKNAKTIGVATVACVLIGVFYVFVAKPVYKVDIVVQVESAGSDLMGAATGGLIGGLSSLFDVKSTDDGEMEILRSRLVTEPVVDNLKMYIDAKPRYFPIVGAAIARRSAGLSTPGLFGVGGYAWGREAITVNTFDVPKDFVDDRFVVTSLGDGRFRLSGNDLDNDVIGVVGQPLQVKTSAGNISLTVSKLVSKNGAEFLLKRHSRLKVLDQLQKDLTISEKGKDQSGVLGVTYESYDPDLASNVLNEIAENYVRQNAGRKAATAERSLEFLSGQLPDVSNQLSLAEDRLSAYQRKHDLIDLDEQAKAMLAQSVDAQTTLFQLEQKRREMSTGYTPEHPAVVAVEQQIAAARANVDTFNGLLKHLPDAQQDLVRLKRDVSVQTQIYVGLLNSIQQLRLATASKIGNVRVIDRAVVPDRPVQPKLVWALAISLAFGVLAGVSTAAAREALFGGLTDPMDIERDASLNVIATIPLSAEQRQLSKPSGRKDRSPAVLALTCPYEPAVEALRSLCTALQFTLLERPENNLVLMTGPSAGTGKSFISANVAVLLGLSNKRVLLIDGDLRRGHLAKEFGVSARTGLSNMLRDGISLDDALARSISPNVDFLATGPLISQAVELLSSGGLAGIVQEASARYDIVLVDAPPLLPVSDATVIAPFAGTILMATRSGMTSSGEILECVKRIERVGASVTGAVFNGFQPSLRSARYGNYGGYAYAADAHETQLESH